MLLFLVAMIWGGGFIFVQILLDSGMSAGLVSVFRGLIFTACTFALFFKKIIKMTARDVKVGLIAGVTNALGFLLQTIGQSMTTSSHAALITVTYVIFVPIICWIFWKVRPGLKTAIAVIMCVIGAFLLVKDFTLEADGKAIWGDLLVLISAVMFGLNIAYLGRSGKQTHYGVVSFFMGVSLFGVSIIYTLAFKQYSMPTGNYGMVILSMLYLGVLSSSLCQILQVVCQRHTSPESASMILILEGFFGGVLSLFYGDTLTVNLVLGGLIIIAAVLLQECDVNILAAKMKNLIKRE